MITKLLIANRGEIACRIIRTARAMGIATVAVHSDADADALHARQADESVRIGGPQASESYLDGDAIIAAAKDSGAQAVHPGYGFLSENADFAEACEAAGLIFVGPPAEAIRAMGDKARAKAIMLEAAVPVVPGYDGENQDPGRLVSEAETIGFPLLIKAVAGGGGRGMRRVDRAEDFSDALESAVREARSAFGDGRVLIEKLITDARHIEIQVFADAHGNCVHMGERDCSAQRRHQKIIEEAPSPFVDAAMGASMAVDAVAAAKAVGYVGAGTVEFIIGADRQHHFLEMNTRLQVEHPVTELVTGLDLVEWQLRVAMGERLPLEEEEIDFSGHAIEARVYAEDPGDGFSPQTGPVLLWKPALRAGEAGVRIDSGVEEGDSVTPYYDPMVAKVVAHGRDRDEAVARLVKGLRERPLFGLRTNRGFLIDLLTSREFLDASVTTAFVDRWVAEGYAARLTEAEDWHFGVAACVLAMRGGGDWFRSTGVASCPILLASGGTTSDAVVEIERGNISAVEVGEVNVELSDLAITLDQVRFSLAGTRRYATYLAWERDLWLDFDGRTFVFHEPDPLAKQADAADPARIVSPVAGLLRAISVAAGDRVEAGQKVAVVEAMKMETTLAARAAGTVRAVHCATGDQVRVGDLVAELEPQA
ncbi:ATP-grasp domain-containing protein [Nitratireductor mangrovi]|uniref:ATP-grasp domain-containing protein n=1 Tax=Nitratireductor mangrovi TaxID=2599600 RepID=A0A5B8L483_9HYPH|nr:biotin carboxylase N-terminal domain-containing protein [Nitratireductor mangrovi]QDZ02735.1 ATP-grasp domain-containing protein [Nitratireductor mangrovi]